MFIVLVVLVVGVLLLFLLIILTGVLKSDIVIIIRSKGYHEGLKKIGIFMP